MNLNTNLLFFTVCLVLAIISELECTGQKKCGYEHCNPGKAGMVNVHIVSHTHDDAGWVLTLEQYYRAYVRDIIHSVVYHLNENPSRRFVYVESAFFWIWWNEQSSEMRLRVKGLVEEGRLEFLGGGWVMNDEAVTHYENIIDQMTIGLRFLNNTFGSCAVPKTVWQIDPFGHSKEQASLFAQMKFDGLFLGRLDYEDIKNRKSKNTMEFMWQGSDTLGSSSQIFTGILPNVYWPPPNFCYDVNCFDVELNEQNIEEKSKDFIEVIKSQRQDYRTNHTIITMGMDFHYRYAGKWFRNLEKLMAHVNAKQENGSKINLFYSTPGCYLKSLHQERVEWPIEKDDFFPYASEAHSYWTGYFTSRPTLKYYSRRATAVLQACRQLVTFASMPNAKIFTLQRAVAIMQHHDAITGTEKQHVTKDYSKSLAEGISLCQEEMRTALSRLIPGILNRGELSFCNNLNETRCEVSKTKSQFKVIAYNSLTRRLHTYIRIPVPGEGFEVHNATGHRLTVQVINVPNFLQNLTDRSESSGLELIFPAHLPYMGATTFTVIRSQSLEPMDDTASWLADNSPNDLFYRSISNEFFEVKMNEHGLLSTVFLKSTGQEVPLEQNFYYYSSQPGFLNEKASGAYSFNPQYNTPSIVEANVTSTVYKGELVQEIRQTFGQWVSQVIRLYKGKQHIEFDWVVGPIPTRDYVGKEVISRFNTNWVTGGIFYTDSNSRETIERKRDHRSNWNLTVLEPVSGNYYPVTGWIYLKDELNNLQLTLLPDRAQGGSSILDGSLEMMVHRRILYDDGYGVDEPLNEVGEDNQGLVVRGRHLLVLNTIEKSVQQLRELSKEMYHEPHLLFMPFNQTLSQESNSIQHFSALTSQLPPNVHILTLELLNYEEVLIRLEHIYEAKESIPYSNLVSVSLKKLFCMFSIVSVRETTLSANQYLDEVRPLEWSTLQQQTEEAPNILENSNPSNTEEGFNVLLKPMEIRTFIVQISRTAC